MTTEQLPDHKAISNIANTSIGCELVQQDEESKNNTVTRMTLDRKPLMTESEKSAFINMVQNEKQNIETIEETFGRIKYHVHLYTIMHPDDEGEILHSIKQKETENAT